MSLSAKARRAPLRIVSGAFLLQAGVGKLKADQATAEQLHGMATGTYGFLGNLDPKTFTKALAIGETALGSAILLPIVPPAAAAVGIMGFSGALLNLWWNTEGMHQPGRPLPTPQGTGVAKDIWLFGMGAGLLTDALLEPAHDKKVQIGATVSEKRAAKGRQARKGKRRAKAAGGPLLAGAMAAAQTAQVEVGRRAAKAAAKAAKQAAKAQKSGAKTAAMAGKQLADKRSEYAPIVADAAKQALDAATGAVEQYGPVVADKAKQARDVATAAAAQYGPVAADRAKHARDAASAAAAQYGPVAADRAKHARDTAAAAAAQYGLVAAERAKQARESAREAAAAATAQYGPIAAERAKQARDAAQLAADRAKMAADRARVAAAAATAR